MLKTRPVVAAEWLCLAIFFAWLIWLPLPFGSVVDRARVPLIAVPLALCLATSLTRLAATKERTHALSPTVPWIVFGTGALVMIAVGAFQLTPLPAAVHAALSSESYAIWTQASEVARLGGEAKRALFPLTIDPPATRFEIFRIAGLWSAFTVAALLVRTHERRMALAAALCAAAAFEALYGLREAALQRFEIWGWVNKLVFNRVTGTFVNPNHFAHYEAIILPCALFLLAVAWRVSGSDDTPPSRRLALLLERHVLLAGAGILGASACLMAVMLAQSRGALLALGVGLLSIAALYPGRRALRIGFLGAAGAALLVLLVVYLGPQRTVGRFIPNELERETLVGRRIGISAAVGVWRRFPLFGSGLGTFERVVSMEQRDDLGKIYHHAHNDYLELAATGGALGFVAGAAALLAGWVALARLTFGAGRRELSWRRRSFQAAALASLTVAMVHALLDFNFYIPANAATLSAILGAACASVHHDTRSRR
jgi:putative inorganic carbon (HCO3(-)) transporter